MKKINIFTFVVIILHITNCVESSNILTLFAVASPSNQLWSQVLINALAFNGHNVTVLTVDLPKNVTPISQNIHYIHLENVYKALNKVSPSKNESETSNLINASPFMQIPLFYDFGVQICKGILNSKGFKTLLDYPDDFKFDLILYDFTVGGMLLGFVYKFHFPPLIGLSPFHIPPSVQDLIGGHYYPAYIPFYSLTYDVDMNFWQRIYNTVLYTYDVIYRRMIITPQLDSLLRPVFGLKMPYIGSIEKRTILTLVNTHSSVNYPHPLPPNVIEIGGMQIQVPKPLEKDLEDFIHKSKKGTILISLGTNMSPQDVKQEKISTILSAIKKFVDYNFLWKFDELIKEKIPVNVLIRPFFPQNDVLGHSKLKLFITHAGGLSTQEATWYGVPMVGIPLFLDQHRNLHKSVISGVAVKVDYPTMTTDSLTKAIHEVLTNKSYAENMRIRSESFRDRPMKPLDTAVWWIEYILRHPEPKHLKSPVPQLGFFIANSYDVLLFVIFTIFIFVWAIIKLCVLVFNKNSKKYFKLKMKIN